MNVKLYCNLNAALFLIKNDMFNRQPWLHLHQLQYVIPPIGWISRKYLFRYTVYKNVIFANIVSCLFIKN